ncbi:Hypothetical predicted protein, partial [Paramuricea clavata]
EWQDTEIQLQLIGKGISKRIRRQLLSKEHMLQEFARAQEIADGRATRIERRVKIPKPEIDEVYETRVTTKTKKVQRNVSSVAANFHTKVEGQSAGHGARNLKFATNPTTSPNVVQGQVIKRK